MDSVAERFREIAQRDREAGRLRPLQSYQRLFTGHEPLIAEEYEKLVGATPVHPVEPASSASHVLELLRDKNRERYAEEGEIARGGMGAIKKIRDETLHRDLAMKTILPERVDGEEGSLGPYLHRFLEEAQVTAQLDHPGVVPVHELGIDDAGQVYFTMKLVKGRTLSEIFELVREGREDWTKTRAIQLFIRVCETLAFAHTKGVIHRDLKPANIMVGNYGEVYVMDWGLAKVLGERAEPDAARTPEPTTLVRTAPFASGRPAPSSFGSRRGPRGKSWWIGCGRGSRRSSRSTRMQSGSSNAFARR